MDKIFDELLGGAIEVVMYGTLIGALCWLLEKLWSMPL